MSHTCHWPGCKVEVPPSLWGCKAHWFRLPADIRAKIWRAYVPGQEITKTPSAEYMAAADEAQIWIREQGGMPKPPPVGVPKPGRVSGLSTKQLAMIHASAKKAEMNDTQYRTVLRTVAGVESAKDLDQSAFEKVMAVIEAAIPDGGVYWQRKADQRGTSANERMLYLIRNLFDRYKAMPNGGRYELAGLVSRFSGERTRELTHLKPQEAWQLIEMLKAKLAAPATPRASPVNPTLFGEIAQPAVPAPARQPRAIPAQVSRDPWTPIPEEDIPF